MNPRVAFMRIIIESFTFARDFQWAAKRCESAGARAGETISSRGLCQANCVCELQFSLSPAIVARLVNWCTLQILHTVGGCCVYKARGKPTDLTAE